MKTFIYPFALTTLCVFALGLASITGCTANKTQVPPKTPVGEVNIDRHDIPLGNDVDQVVIENPALKDFIIKYNEAQDNPSLRVNDDYKVSYDDFSKAYHVISNNVNLTVHIDDGKLVFAGISADSGLPVEKELEVANAVFKIMKANGNVPARVLAYMQDVKDRAEDLELQATEAYQRIDDTLKGLDTDAFLNGIHDIEPDGSGLNAGSLPETTIPPLEDIEIPDTDEP